MQRIAGHRHGIGRLGGGSLGQARQAVGEIVDSGVAGGALGVFEAIFEQRTKRLVPALRLPCLSLDLVHQGRQGIDGWLTILGAGLGRIGGVGRGRALGLGSLLQRQAQGRQVGQWVGIRVEGLRCRVLGQLFGCRGLR
ncbi:hypothetical protein D3C79_795540 [compost metagenome]